MPFYQFKRSSQAIKIIVGFNAIQTGHILLSETLGEWGGGVRGLCSEPLLYKVKTAHALNNVLIFSKFEILQTFLTKYQF